MSKQSDYQVMARSMRPQRFEDVVGQEKTKTTLKNAFQLGRLSHAYLFCGFHGIGKTTLARLFAKMLNCDAPENGEPCNQCASCREITACCSLDVIEIDGASNRGIDDIRQINETVSFAVKGNKHKIYILDEVHMLTKEAFNALLKTLEAPPEKVTFIFATTEPHKIPTTILSRCQCFYLEPITSRDIQEHILKCTQKMGVEFEASAAELVAKRARGSLRDALVLADQLITYCQKGVTEEKATHFLGLLPKNELFDFDLKGAQNDLDAACSLAQSVISSGKNLTQFLDMLCEHFRQILYIKIYRKNPPSLKVSDNEWPAYEKSAGCYSYDQCLYIIDLILETQTKINRAASKQIALENLLIQIVRSHQRVSVQSLIDQLDALKSKLGSAPTAAEKAPVKPAQPAAAPPPLKEEKKPVSKKELTPKPPQVAPPSEAPKPSAEKPNICYNTVMQFASVELEGSLKKEGN